MFEVLEVDTGCVVGEHETPHDATAKAKELSAATGKKHKIRKKLEAIDWKAREQARFDSGEYEPVKLWIENYSFQPIPSHFLHVSKKDRGKLAYTENDEKGAADRQTVMRPGAYLQRYFPHYGETNIKLLANAFVAEYGDTVLQFAKTADEIEHVYTHGPSSCMSHGAHSYESPFHPVRVYGAGDLAIAYVTDGEDDGTIIARALCWPEKKIYGRVYGQEERLVSELEKLEFSDAYEDGDSSGFHGARLTRHETDDCVYVVPYVDGVCSAKDNGKHLILGRGDIDCQRTNGLSGDSCTCDDCGCGLSEDETYHPDHGGTYCESCYNEHTFYCEHCEESHWGQDDATSVRVRHRRYGMREETWCQSCATHDAFECEGNGNLYHDELKVELADGTVWSAEYFEEHGTTCDDCSDAIACDDAVPHKHGTYCADCAEEHKEDDDNHKPKQGRDESPTQTELELEVA